jgi:hypothetical protein
MGGIRGESFGIRDTRAEARVYGWMPLARQEDGIPAVSAVTDRSSAIHRRDRGREKIPGRVATLDWIVGTAGSGSFCRPGPSFRRHARLTSLSRHRPLTAPEFQPLFLDFRKICVAVPLRQA